MLNMKDKKRQCSMAAVGLAFILYNLGLVIFISVSRYYFLNRWLEFYLKWDPYDNQIHPRTNLYPQGRLKLIIG